jgi:excisionase family DNA binding protein
VADDREEFLTLVEVARLLRCSVRTVNRRIRDGSLPAIKLGHLTRVRRADLDKALVGARPAAARRRKR